MIALSIAISAKRFAPSRLEAVPDFGCLPGTYTVHLQPVGLAVWTTLWDALVLHEETTVERFPWFRLGVRWSGLNSLACYPNWATRKFKRGPKPIADCPVFPILPWKPQDWSQLCSCCHEAGAVLLNEAANGAARLAGSWTRSDVLFFAGLPGTGGSEQLPCRVDLFQQALCLFALVRTHISLHPIQQLLFAGEEVCQSCHVDDQR